MTELKTHVNNENGTYEVTMLTDNKENYSLAQHLVRSLIDKKQCFVHTIDNLGPCVVSAQPASDYTMTLVYYDPQMPKKSFHDLTQRIREVIGTEVLFLPKSLDVYLNASEEQLLSAKNTIEGALALKKAN